MIAITNRTPISITGLGCHVPERVVTNDDLSKLVDTSDEWIRTRTGIRERRYAADDQALSDIALPATKRALEQAGVAAADVDLLIVATVTPDMFFPSTAAILADQLGATDAAAYDLSAGCTGFMYGIAQAAGMLAAGLSRRSLVVGADVLSKVMNFADRSTCVLFGDGAGAVIVGASSDERYGILDFEHEVDGRGGPALCMPAGGSRLPATHETVDQRLHYVKQEGQTVFKFAVTKTNDVCARLLARNKLTAQDIDLFVSHQANRRIILSAAERLGLPQEKVVINIDRFGNTTAATIPLALNDAIKDGRVKRGDLVLLTSVGAGFTVGAVLMRWGI
jgi:3-oxoacyl-[acyl-carrier-protein] synthase III